MSSQITSTSCKVGLDVLFAAASHDTNRGAAITSVSNDEHHCLFDAPEPNGRSTTGRLSRRSCRS